MFQAHRLTGHRRGLSPRLHRAGRRPVSTAVLIPATLCRVAPAQTLPRGESGPEAGDGSAAQTCSSVLPRRTPTSVSAGFVFSKQNTGISFRACPRSQNAKPATARFLRRGFPYGFSRGIPCLPIPGSILSRPHRLPAPWVPTQSEECDDRTGEYRENEAGEDCGSLQDGKGTMIRHMRAWGASPGPRLALPVAMIEPPFGAALMALIGAPALLAPRRVDACGAAIPMPAVAVRAKEEHRPAIRAKTKPLQQYRLMRRHACRRRARQRRRFVSV